MQHNRQDEGGEIELDDYQSYGYRYLVSLAAGRKILKRGMDADEIRAALMASDEQARRAAQDEAAHG